MDIKPDLRPLTLREIEQKAMDEALARNNGNRSHAARDLKCSIRKIRYWANRIDRAKLPNG